MSLETPTNIRQFRRESGRAALWSRRCGRLARCWRAVGRCAAIAVCLIPLNVATADVAGRANVPAAVDDPAARAALPGTALSLSRARYAEQLEGFWLGQCIANWTGLITEMDKIGGEGPHGEFYTREDWGGPDQPSIWGEGIPSDLSPVIDWYLVGPEGTWGADDDTDIEFMYQHLALLHGTALLSGEQIRDGWLAHIYDDATTPFRDRNGEPENYLWVSNQAAHDLMRERGLVPPATSDPDLNPHTDMIDAQLTTELFGLFAPGRPDAALRLAELPIRTSARGEAAIAAEFYVVLHALVAGRGPGALDAGEIHALAGQARHWLPDDSTTARMFDHVWGLYREGQSWEAARDAIYRRYQVEQADGYDISSRNLYCNGCFASGINYAASLVSLFWGDGDFRETVKIAVLAGWDSDNPAATWGGLLGFTLGADALEAVFGQPLSRRFDIHRTRGGFPGDGKTTFPAMAEDGVRITDRVVVDQLGGRIDMDEDRWLIPAGASAPGAVD